MLVCQNCGTLNSDPGGDPRCYYCGRCGQLRLQRISAPQQQVSNNTVLAAIAGAALGGLAAGGPIGALLGAVVGGILGSRVSK